MNNIITIIIGDIEDIGIDLLIRLWKLKKLKYLYYFQISKFSKIFYEKKLKFKN